MSNEIEQYEPAGQLAETYLPPSGMARVAASLQDHVEALKSADYLAGMIHKSVTAYDGGRDSKGKQRPGQKEAAIAIYHGQQLGLEPLAALQNIFTVHGTPSMYARTMRALVVQAGHAVETVESSATSATVRAKRAGSDTWESATWTIERATTAGYATNAKYHTEPENMLYARACAEVCRRLAPDVLLGMAYSKEELDDTTPVRATAERVRPGKGVDGLRAALAPKPVDEPVADVSGAEVLEHEPAEAPAEPEAPADPAPAPADDKQSAPCTTVQRRALGVVLKKEGLTEDSARFEWISTTVQRPIVSYDELTVAEAGEIIAFLQDEQKADEQKANR